MKLFEAQPWMIDGVCVDHPRREVFFTEGRGPSKLTKEAQEICATCPIWRTCLDYALKNCEEFGVWGGLNINERRQVRKGVNVQKCPRCRLIRVFNPKEQRICDRCIKFGYRSRKGPG